MQTSHHTVRQLRTRFCVYSYKNCDCGDCRFETTVRIVIFSGSLTSACWEDVQQFGWFIDVNIQDEDGSCVETLSSGSFAKDLDHFVASMTQSEHADILRGVDFSVVSPHVCLIASVQGEPRKSATLLQIFKRVVYFYVRWSPDSEQRVRSSSRDASSRNAVHIHGFLRSPLRRQNSHLCAEFPQKLKLRCFKREC